jgi:tyrosine-protein kinase Etk/Wzc
LLGLGDLPELGVQYLTLFREVKKFEAMVAALTAQVEAARIAEVRDADVVTIIDRARVPDRKSGPPRAQITVAGVMLGLLAGCAWALITRRPRRATQGLT